MNNAENTQSLSVDNLSANALTELHKMAQRYMSKENPGHTLQVTALVNEAYLSLLSSGSNKLERLHFFALAATHMRHILVDHARRKAANKREANALAVTANDEILVDAGNADSLVLLDEVLTQFSAMDERAAKIYELRLFAGLSSEEIADAMEISKATVERDLRLAKAWVNQHFNN